jgi:hypothetical protein
MPDRPSAVRLTRATPSLVRPCSSMRPRVVKNCTTVPSGTAVPGGSMTTAVTTATPPWAVMKVGLALSRSVEPAGAVSSACPHERPSRATIPSARHVWRPIPAMIA